MAAVSSSVWSLLAQGVVDSLNLQTFAPAAESFRGWKIYLQRTDTTDPTITVVPTAKNVTNASRKVNRNTVSLAILVQRQIGATDSEDIPAARCDEIAALAQQVEDCINDTDNKITVDDGNGEAWVAVCTGDINAEVVQEWIADGIFAVTFTAEFTLFR